MRRWIAMLAWLLLAGASSSAREWRSADGARTLEARFVALKGGQLSLGSADGRPRVFPLAAFSAADQKFAANAQAIADAAVKWGPQSLEISQVVEGGCICRLALPPANGAPALFSGEMFFLTGGEAAKADQGAQIKGRLLFGAGGRMYHPLKGGPSLIRAFALDAEEATQVWMDTVGTSNGDVSKQSPSVMEPAIEIVTTRGIGIAVGKSGLFVIDASMTKDAGLLVVHRDGEDHPAKVVKADEKLGVAVVSCVLPVEPARIGSKKPAGLGQSVYAVCAALNNTKRALAGSPTVSRGVVSRITDAQASAFEHDATVAADSLGGFIVGLKGEALGVFFTSQTTSRALTSKKSKPAGAAGADAFGKSIGTAALAAFLDGVPGAGALRTSPTETDIGVAAKELMKGVVLVSVTRDVAKPRVIAAGRTKSKATPAAATTGGTAAGWSLSKSGTRHNSTCRFYDASAPCAATDGKPCKACGG
ncbi:MAG: trypsin-like peptidase domain-containing protein [Verrucomicrobiaceae bacterium]|nr:trypsin-like peptidase domain-containing protein [Verrucomicrobiaceae bacterium]